MSRADAIGPGSEYAGRHGRESGTEFRQPPGLPNRFRPARSGQGHAGGVPGATRRHGRPPLLFRRDPAQSRRPVRAVAPGRRGRSTRSPGSPGRIGERPRSGPDLGRTVRAHVEERGEGRQARHADGPGPGRDGTPIFHIRENESLMDFPRATRCERIARGEGIGFRERLPGTVST